MTSNTRLRVIAGLLLVAALIPFALYATDLPDPMASNWGTDGRPNGSLPIWGFIALTALLVGGGLFLGHALGRGTEPSPESAAATMFFGVFAAGLAWAGVLANRGAASWDEAGSIGWFEALVAVAAAVGAALVAHRAWMRRYPPPLPRRDPHRHGDVPVVPPSPGEQAAWSGSVVVRWPLLIVAVGVGAFVVVPSGIRWLMLVGPLVALFLLRSRAVVSAAGLEVWLGPARVRRIPMERISHAEIVDVEPRLWGGWGWRVVGDASALVARAGEGMLVRFHDGRAFVITVDDAARGAGLLNWLLSPDR